MKNKKGLNYWFPLLVIIFGICYTTLYNKESYSFTGIEELTKIKEIFTGSINNEPNKQENVELNTEVSSDLKIEFIDVGQADAILISNNNEHMLIDAGNNPDGKKLVKYLESKNVSTLKYAVGTHPHEDHIGGMDNIITAFNIENFYMPDAITTTKTFEDVLTALNNKNYKFRVPKIGDILTLGEAKLEVLYTGTDTSDLNNTSIVLMLHFGAIKVLFMGDAPSEVEKELLNKDIKADVLKVGHHGSQYSSSIEFLKKVSPKYSVIQVGLNNTYDHPKKIILTRLNEINSTVYRTDEKGTIIMKSNGKTIDFSFVKTDTNG